MSDGPTKETLLKMLHEYCDFSDPNWVWMLVGMARNKDNEFGSQHNTPEQFMRRLVIRKPSEIEECYDEIRLLANRQGTTYRMYVSLNSRDSVSAFFHFQQKLAENGYGLARQLNDALVWSKKVHSKWKTELAQRRNRGTKRILFDIDENDDVLFSNILTRLAEQEIKVYVSRPTVSGFAISCDAHDTRWLKKEFPNRELDIKKDSLLFVEQWEGTRP
jgi:hypothetical protein